MEELKQQMETILRGLDALKGAHDQVRHELTAKLDRLEKDVAAGQEETAQLVVKRIKREPAQPQFKRKGNEKQFTFNAQISDSVQTAVGLLDKLKPEQPQAAVILKMAKEQLEEGMQAITDRQKLIRFADRSQYGWGAVEEYLQEDIAKDEKEAKKWADAEKSMEAKMRRKRTLDDRGYSDGDPQHTRPMPPPPPVCAPPPPPSHSCPPGLLGLEDHRPGCPVHALIVCRWDTSKLSARWGQPDCIL